MELKEKRMKAVLLSIQPKWCELIASGKKTVEVRKTRPKLETPFKCYIYCTQGDALAVPCLNNPHYAIHRMNNGTPNCRQMTEEERGQSDHQFANGKVIGEFVCNLMTSFKAMGEVQALYNEAKETCISHDEIIKYANGKRLYYWHISDLKIYDTPKALSEFCHPCDRDPQCDCRYCVRHGGKKPILRAPQSWRYVEALNG